MKAWTYQPPKYVKKLGADKTPWYVGWLDPAGKRRSKKEPGKLPTYVAPEHFAQIYNACDKARMSAKLSFPAADWWRGLLVMAYVTGWRIGVLLALLREDNAKRQTADALQKLMRHKSYLTTQRDINMAGQLNEAVEVLHVPGVLKENAG